MFPWKVKTNCRNASTEPQRGEIPRSSQFSGSRRGRAFVMPKGTIPPQKLTPSLRLDGPTVRVTGTLHNRPRTWLENVRLASFVTPAGTAFHADVAQLRNRGSVLWLGKKNLSRTIDDMNHTPSDVQTSRFGLLSAPCLAPASRKAALQISMN